MNDSMKALKKEAEQLGIEVHHRWNEETLQNKINEQLATMFRQQAQEASEESAVEAPVEATKTTKPVDKVKRYIRPKTASQYAAESFSKRRDKAASLVRVIVTCLDPNKRAWQGEIVSVGSSKLGTFKKYIPYGIEWHIPRILLDVLKEKKCSTFYNVPDNQGGILKKAKQISAYSIMELPPLTEEELKELARSQARAA